MTAWALFEIIVNALEFYGITAFLALQLKISRPKKRRLVLAVAAALSIVSVINILDLYMNFVLFGAITIYVSRILTFVLFFIISSFFFEGSISEKFVCACMPLFVMAFSDFVAMGAVQIIEDATIGELRQFGRDRMIGSTIYLAVSAIVYGGIIYAQRKKERINVILFMHLRILLVITLLLGTVAIDQLIDFILYANKFTADALRIKSIFICTSFFIILLCVFALILRIGELTIDLLHSQHEKLTYQSYKELENSYSAIKTEKHDIKNHLNTLNGLCAKKNFDKLEEYLQDMAGQYVAVDFVDTGNIPLDVLISSKLAAAKAANVDFKFEVKSIEVLKISYTDLCSIVGNLLDNAIEACERLPSHICRFISLKINDKEQMLNITINNSYTGYFKKRGNTFLSLKSSPMNGLGLQICASTVKRYGGLIYIDTSDNIFKVSITIPVSTNERNLAYNAKNCDH